MDRKTVKIDRKTLEDLTSILKKARTAGGLLLVGDLIGGLGKLITYHPNFAAEVSVPVEE